MRDIDGGAQSKPTAAAGDSVSAFMSHLIVMSWQTALDAAAAAVAREIDPAKHSSSSIHSSGGNDSTLAQRIASYALAMLEGVLDAAGLCALGDGASLRSEPP